MFNSVFAAVLSAAVLVTAKNTTFTCTPVVSGKLQSWSFNGTDALLPMGVNATKSGEFVSVNVTHPSDVVYERCAVDKDSQVIVGPTSYAHVALKNDKDWCVTHNAGKTKKAAGLLVLERCSTDPNEVGKTQEFGLVYGANMRHQNATLIAQFNTGNCTGSLPVIANFRDGTQSRKDTPDMVAGMISVTNGASLLQIGNPKEH